MRSLDICTTVRVTIIEVGGARFLALGAPDETFALERATRHPENGPAAGTLGVVVSVPGGSHRVPELVPTKTAQRIP